MAVAVCMRFDGQMTALVEQLWRALGSDLLELGYPPHLTLVVVSDEADAGGLHRALPQIAGQVPGLIEIGDVRVFPDTDVVYLECRSDLRALHRLVADLVPVGAIHEHYRPETWVPHVTLQTKGDPASAMAVAGAGWRACDAVPVALDLVTFPPVAVLASASVDQR